MLVQPTKKSKVVSLGMLFKTHKVKWPIRVIITEQGSWQKNVALFLQKNLKFLAIDYPFYTKNSDQVVGFLTERFEEVFNAYSIDIKDILFITSQTNVGLRRSRYRNLR